jgi:hypothetical protein
VENVAQLPRLEFIPREFGFPLTLLVTYPVVRNPSCRKILRHWQERHGAEIGAHLHPWNTPPFLGPEPEPPRPAALPTSLLEAKLATLLASLKEGLGLAPRSFRMGRFDVTPEVLRLLPEYGLQVDSSLVPLRRVRGGPDHFLVPPDPYPLRPAGPSGPILWEAPLTQVPLWAGAPETLQRLAGALPSRLGELLLSSFHSWGALGIHPAWFPLPSMRVAARLHRRRGGRVLTMFLHSSELLPGATPHCLTETAVRRLLDRLRAFLAWLARTAPVQGVTLAELVSSEQ